MSDGPVFLVGFPRSGTTLLSAMLSRHPRLAMTHEWRFVPSILEPRRDGTMRTAEETLEDVLATPKVDGHLVDAEAARRRLATLKEPSPADAIRCMFELYAEALGKPRWGDKTPRNLRHLDLLASAFPDAQFIHIVRDGREVADANRDAPWGGGTGPSYWASQWSSAVAVARTAGARLGGERYIEVRYERLVTEPRLTLGELCAFIGETFVDAQLDYAESVEGYAEMLPKHHRNLLLPPTPGLRDWESKWSRRDRVAFEAIAGPLLDQLGYPRSVPPPPSWRSLTGEAVAITTGVWHRAVMLWRENHPTPASLARRFRVPSGILPRRWRG